MVMTDDPRELVLRHRAGDVVATEALMERALTLALRTAAAVLRDREAARDLAQDVGVEVIRGVGRLRDGSQFDAWVHRITVRLTMRSISRRRVEVCLDTVEEPQAIESLPEAVLADGAAIRAAIARLPERQQVAIVLRYVHGLSSEEASAALGCRAGTVDSLLSRARTALRFDPLLANLAVERGVTR